MRNTVNCINVHFTRYVLKLVYKNQVLADNCRSVFFFIKRYASIKSRIDKNINEIF